MGVIKGDTRSLESSPHGEAINHDLNSKFRFLGSGV